MTPGALTRHGNHGSPGPEDVHARRVTVAQRGVQAHVRQLPPSDVLLLGGHRGEDDTGGGQAHVQGILLDVGLTHCWEAEQPQHAVGHPLQDLDK